MSGFFERMSVARTIVLAILTLIVLAIAVLWYAFEGTHYEARFRLTVEIDTPSGTKSASNVYRYTETPRFYPGGMIPHIEGDAIFVDLGGGKHVVVIMGHGAKAEYPDSFAYAWQRAYKPPVDGKARDVETRPTPADGPRDLKEFNIPTLVTFDDVRDPKTARVVYAWGRKIEMSPSGAVPHDRGPELKIDDIAKVLGDGYAFKRAWVEIVPAGIWPLSALGLPFNFLGLTGTPVTRGIEKRLPEAMAKLDAINKGPMSGRIISLGDPFRLFLGHLTIR